MTGTTAEELFGASVDEDPFGPVAVPAPGHVAPKLPIADEGLAPFILGIDPGTTESGWVLCEGLKVHDSGVMKNDDMLAHISKVPDYGQRLAIEMIASYGMPVGREVFETCVWIGRFKQAWHSPQAVMLVYRKDVKLHLCGTSKAKDPNVRQALIDLYPASGGGKTPQIGTKGQPGPLYGVSSHAWPALGVAITARHQIGGGK